MTHIIAHYHLPASVQGNRLYDSVINENINKNLAVLEDNRKRFSFDLNSKLDKYELEVLENKLNAPNHCDPNRLTDASNK